MKGGGWLSKFIALDSAQSEREREGVQCLDYNICINQFSRSFTNISSAVCVEGKSKVPEAERLKKRRVMRPISQVKVAQFYSQWGIKWSDVFNIEMESLN